MADIELAKLGFYEQWNYVQMIFIEQPELEEKYEDSIKNGVYLRINIEMLSLAIAEKPKKGLVRLAAYGWIKAKDIIIEKQARRRLMFEVAMQVTPKGIRTSRG